MLFGGRLGSSIGVGLLFAATTVLLSAQPAFAAECDRPTQVINGNSAPTLTLASGEVGLIASDTFTGGINAVAPGATLCVAAGATLQPAYLNNIAGRLVNEGTTTFPAFITAAAAEVENNGQLNLPNGLTDSGPSSLLNQPGGTVTAGTGISLPAGATISNQGAIQVTGPVDLSDGSRLDNSGTLTVTGPFTDRGTVSNAGDLTVGAPLTVDGSFANACRTTSAGLTNDAVSTNSGVLSTGPLVNQGRLQQSPTGIAVGTDFTSPGTVTGFGRYSYRGATVNAGLFTGSAAATPIRFDDTSPTGSQLFDTLNGTAAQAIRDVVVVPPPAFRPPGCSDALPASTDLVAGTTGPAAVVPGGPVTYTLTVTNLGPADAGAVVVTDAVAPTLTAVTSTPAGTARSGSLMWTLGTIAAGDRRTLTVRGTAPAAGTLSNVVSAITSTPDADPTNSAGQVATAVSVPPANHAPLVADVATSTVVDVPITLSVVAADPDPGQTVTWSLVTPPTHGTATVQPDGVISYQPATGVDSFAIQGCDNGTPVLCDNATVAVTVVPLAVDVHADSVAGTAVVIPVRAATVTRAPGNGIAVAGPDGDVSYTPDDGFLGTDTFEYQVCAPTAASVCASATATVDVLAPVAPPVVGDDPRMTTVDTPVDGLVSLSNSSGRPLVLFVGTPPTHGTVTPTPDGHYTYTPDPGFAGGDGFTLVGCDATDRLCATGQIALTILAAPSPTPAVLGDRRLPVTTGLALIWPMLVGVLVAVGVFLAARADRRRTT